MTNTEWSVLVGVEIGADIPVEEWADDILDYLEGLGPTVSVRPGRVTVRLSIDDPDFRLAGDAAVHVVTEALGKCCLDPGQVVHLEVETADDLAAQLEEPTFPALLGVAEVAELLGVTKQRASALAMSKSFPRPIAELKAGPIWAEPMVRRFVAEWPRRSGRPRPTPAVG